MLSLRLLIAATLLALLLGLQGALFPRVARADTIRFDFESGTLQRWEQSWGPAALKLSNSSAQASSGTQSLAIGVPGQASDSAIEQTAILSDFSPGTQVNFRIYAPSATTIAVSPFADDRDWRETFGPPNAIVQGWQTVSWTIPSALHGLEGVGFEINNWNAWGGTLYTDAISSGPLAAGAGAGLHASGSQLLDAGGNPVRLRGVNRSSFQYACLHGYLHDGPMDQAEVAGMRAWHVNAVRLPLNEDCWLGRHGVDPAYAGPPTSRPWRATSPCCTATASWRCSPSPT